MNYEKPFIVAEICCNHMGSVKIAKKMIKKAKDAGADAVKFQKRSIEIWSERKKEVYEKSHPDKKNSFGKTYKEHREYLELTFEEHKDIKEYCDKLNIQYSASVWDIESAKEICSLNPKFIKISSACNQNYDLLKWICNNYYGDIHLSLGMTSKKEIDDIISFFKTEKRNKDLYLYICTSGYPVMYEDMCLLEISNLHDRYSSIVKGVAFSGHHIGTAIDIAAYTLGASIIERHFTLNKNMKGTDQKVSLTDKELTKLIKDLNDTRMSLKFKSKDILDIEISNKVKLKW